MVDLTLSTVRFAFALELLYDVPGQYPPATLKVGPIGHHLG
jgi:hypothetical protein